MPGFGFAQSATTRPAEKGVVPSVSASQFKDFTRCQRLWWFHKVALVKEREKQHFVIGHCLHERAEIYQVGKPGDALYPPGWDKGLDEDERKWIQDSTSRAISLGMWERIPGRLVEFPLSLLVGPTDSRGMPLVARADVYLDESGVRKISPPTALANGDPLPFGWDNLPHYNGFVDFLDLVLPAPLVGDHKSAKNRRYALTPEKLRVDVQMNCYAAGVLSLLPEANIVRLRHNVFLKDPAAPTPSYQVNTEVFSDEVARHWFNVVDWSRKMDQLRKSLPAGQGALRADNWHRVKSAIEEGRPDECSGYGRCPFRDVCYGRCTAEQLLNRLDAPDPTVLSKPPETTFGLRSKTTPEKSTMAFGRPSPSFAVGQDIYILDPENNAIQYRARIDVLDSAPGESNIVLWPNADVEPEFGSLGINYRILVPKSALMAIPLATAKVMGYADALRAAGTTDGLEWSPAVKQPTVAPVAVETAKIPEKPAADKAFGLKTSAASAPTPPPVALTAATTACPLTNTGAGTKVGDKLVVVPSEHKFWKPLEGKEAQVVEIMPGEIPGTVLFSVVIDGHPYPDVLPARFAVPPNSTQAFVYANCGKMVAMVLDKGALTVSAVIESVSNDGFTILSGSRKVAWADIESIELFDEKKHVPVGAKEEAKAAAKEAKQAEKEAAKAEKAAAKEAAKVEAPAGEVPPEQSLAEAIAAVELALQAGKTTKKVVEALMPALKRVQAHMASGGITEPAAVVVPAPAASAGDPVVRGAIKVALTHAISVLTDAMNKIGE